PGSPGTHNVLLCRDFVEELANPHHFPAEGPERPLTTDRLIKAMIGFELHGLMDWAYALAETFSDLLQPRLDVLKAKRLLLSPPGELRYYPDLVKCIQAIDQQRRRLESCAGRYHEQARRLTELTAALDDQARRLDERTRDLMRVTKFLRRFEGE